jgi:hypothetical protein
LRHADRLSAADLGTSKWRLLLRGKKAQRSYGSDHSAKIWPPVPKSKNTAPPTRRVENSQLFSLDNFFR